MLIELTGLKSNVPIGFMAALGAFRHALGIGELGGVKLGWTRCGGHWCAVLDTGHTADAPTLARLFLERLKSMHSRPEFEWSKALKNVAPNAFREQSKLAIEKGWADWFQAFGSELASKDDKIQPTPFDMTVARQLFLDDAAWLTKDLATPDRKGGDEPNIRSFHEALFGPWQYQDDQHSIGWDPSTILMGAFTPKAPTVMSKAGVRAAVWLAMESLPFFPCFFDQGLAASGFQKQGRQFRWAVWERPLGIAAIRVMIQHAASLTENDMIRGFAAVYSSKVFKPNKYLTSFQPAVLEMVAD